MDTRALVAARAPRFLCSRYEQARATCIACSSYANSMFELRAYKLREDAIQAPRRRIQARENGKKKVGGPFFDGLKRALLGHFSDLMHGSFLPPPANSEYRESHLSWHVARSRGARRRPKNVQVHNAEVCGARSTNPGAHSTDLRQQSLREQEGHRVKQKELCWTPRILTDESTHPNFPGLIRAKKSGRVCDRMDRSCLRRKRLPCFSIALSL